MTQIFPGPVDIGTHLDKILDDRPQGAIPRVLLLALHPPGQTTDHVDMTQTGPVTLCIDVGAHGIGPFFDQGHARLTFLFLQGLRQSIQPVIQRHRGEG